MRTRREGRPNSSELLVSVNFGLFVCLFVFVFVCLNTLTYQNKAKGKKNEKTRQKGLTRVLSHTCSALFSHPALQ